MRKTEICEYCGDDYIPNRRGVQKFCSDSCRSKNWQLKSDYRKPTDNLKIADIDDSIEVIPAEVYNPPTNKIEKISVAGIGNAAIGTMVGNTAADMVKNIFVPEHKKSATKGDIQELKNLIQTRYFEVHNLPNDLNGNKPYFDMATGSIVYYDVSQQRFIAKSDFF